jgi:hypothetical protein
MNNKPGCTEFHLKSIKPHVSRYCKEAFQHTSIYATPHKEQDNQEESEIHVHSKVMTSLC